MKFEEWIKLKEVGTGTSSVASFARPIFSRPLKTRKWPGLAYAGKNEDLASVKELLTKKFSDWIKGRQRMDEDAPQQAYSSATLPQQQGNQPVQTQPMATVSINPAYYKGQNKSAFQKVYQQFLINKNPKLGATLYNAINGNEQDMVRMSTNPGTMNINTQPGIPNQK